MAKSTEAAGSDSKTASALPSTKASKHFSPKAHQSPSTTPPAKEFNFMILKTYSRIFTGSMDSSLGFLEHLTGRKPDYRFKLPEMGIEVSGLADFCVVAGSKEKLDPLRDTQGPLIVDDLAATEKFLVGAGAVITKPNQATVTGRNLFARHPDGSVLEYVEWKPEIRLRILG